MCEALEKIIKFTLSFSGGEVIALVAFIVIKSKLATETNFTNRGFLKGLLERLLLLLGFVLAIPTIVVFFGAIKLGTRLKADEKEKISNDYFLVGNVVSAMIALLEYAIYILLLTNIKQ
jgi:hypothetical protein